MSTLPLRNAAGSLAACLILSLLLGGCNDSKPTEPVRPSVSSVIIAPDTVRLNVGESATIYASALATNGGALPDRVIAWRSSTPAIASVSSAGVVTALAFGPATITAESEGRSASATVLVAGAPDYAIIGAQITQGVQDNESSVPIIRDGSAAAMNVLVRSTGSTLPSMELVLRWTDASGATVREDSMRTIAAPSMVPTFALPSAQALIPAAALRAGLRWQIIRDPRRLRPDANAENDRYPASGPAPLLTVEVPPLNIRFVPIVLSANGDAAPSILPTDLPGYLRTVRSITPVGVVNATVGSPLVTTANFGASPRGGERAFWTQLLQELDAARLLHPTESQSNWYGVVAPPMGFTFTAYGGFSYVSGQAPGQPAARTSLGIRTNWFSRATQARDLVAHELGHAFGRIHTPCGSADPPNDAAYPVTGGAIDYVGHDVYAWANGLATRATTVDLSSGDVMGYCFPAWSSVYTYAEILKFRARSAPLAINSGSANSPSGARTRVMLVRGSIADGATGMLAPMFGESVELAPSFSLDARVPSTPTGGVYRAEGLDANGRVLFSHAFDTAEIDHAPGVRHFAFTVPMQPAAEESLDHIRVRGPSGELRSASDPGLPASASVITADRFMAGVRGRARVMMTRVHGAMRLHCEDAATRGMLVLDATTGEVLGASQSAAMLTANGVGRSVRVLCSDGLRTRASEPLAG